MHINKQKKTIGLIASLAVLASLFVWSTHSEKVDFNADVKPIFNKKCISCHGGVKRENNFSLLFRSEALAKTKSGKPAIIPGNPDGSEMIRRLTLHDVDERMPYHRAPLPQREIDILRRWIKQGAQWGDHWAYVAVTETPVPKPSTSFFGFAKSEDDWARNNVDYFILDKLKQHALKPAPEADKATLLRRVSIDLTGLPPASNLAQTFSNSHAPNAYEVLVDSLLASPHFGERWTAVWLDLARYADTKGYERDDGRNIWRYRDWLIKSFNEDKPYNQFLTEQLAGDLLERPTDEQLIATAFHRNTMTNDEGGTDNEEFRTAAVIDRVNATWDGMLGTTFSCVQCHSHPYDPFTHDEYYKFMAFFNNTRDEDTWADYPLLRQYKGEDSANVLKVVNWFSKNGFKKDAAAVQRFLKTWQPAVNSLLADSFTNGELSDTKWLALRNHGTARLKNIDLNGKNELLFRYQGFVPGGVWAIHLDDANGPVLKTIALRQTKGPWAFEKVSFAPTPGVHDLYFTYSSPALKDPLKTGVMFDWFYFTNTLPGADRQGYDSVVNWYWQLASKEVETTPVMQDNPAEMHRVTNVFERGNWLVKGAVVAPDVPHALNPFPNKAPRNRLGLAQWMTDVRNPLTARTIVNRLWEQLWGTGLVEMLDDLGTQGAEPTHRELLDYLAYQFMHAYNWSIKKLLKELVLSATYRQDSKVSAEALQKDAFNKWYARGARVRLSAEQVRDQALAAAGVLSEKIGGPSVMPWQPDGIWMSPWNGAYWARSKGEDQYRRALYTFWKRTAPYPSMILFDGVGREVCVARRIRTNTPLQALVTLNDSVYLEAARYLAYRMQKESRDSKNIAAQINHGYQLLFYKPIQVAKLQALQNLYQTAYKTYQSDKDKQCEMIGVDDAHNTPETAALVVVASAILNLDETVTKS